LKLFQTDSLNSSLQTTAQALVVLSLWQRLEYTFASWNIKLEDRVVELGLPVSSASLVLFSQTCSLMISSSSSAYCPHFKIEEPVSLILGTSAKKGRKSYAFLLTHIVPEMA